MSKDVMRLLDRSLGLMECRVCGHRHFLALGDDDYVRGAWECQNGCELKGRASNAVVIPLRRARVPPLRAALSRIASTPDREDILPRLLSEDVVRAQLVLGACTSRSIEHREVVTHVVGIGHVRFAFSRRHDLSLNHFFWACDRAELAGPRPR